MTFSQYSLEQIESLTKDDAIYNQLEHLLEQDTDELENLRKVAKIMIKEFELSYKEWQKVMFILKLAKSCHE